MLQVNLQQAHKKGPEEGLPVGMGSVYTAGDLHPGLLRSAHTSQDACLYLGWIFIQIGCCHSGWGFPGSNIYWCSQLQHSSSDLDQLVLLAKGV